MMRSHLLIDDIDVAHGVPHQQSQSDGRLRNSTPQNRHMRRAKPKHCADDNGDTEEIGIKSYKIYNRNHRAANHQHCKNPTERRKRPGNISTATRTKKMPSANRRYTEASLQHMKSANRRGDRNKNRSNVIYGKICMSRGKSLMRTYLFATILIRYTSKTDTKYQISRYMYKNNAIA